MAASAWYAAPSRGGGRGGSGAGARGRGGTFSIRPCAYGATCDDPACRAFHDGGALCRFFPNCYPPMGRRCPFRHPVSALVSTEATASPPPTALSEERTLSPPPPPAAIPSELTAIPTSPDFSHVPVSERVTSARLIHQQLLGYEDSELRRLENRTATNPRANDGVSEVERQARKFAVRAKITELEKQRAVFEAITSRIEMQPQLSRAGKDARLARDIVRFQMRRAIAAVRLDVEEQLESCATSRFLVIKSTDGCGANVRIPQYAVELVRSQPSDVVCIQPTKIQAQVLAAQIAHDIHGDNSSPAVPGEHNDRGGYTVCVSHCEGSIEVVSEFDMLGLLDCARQSSEMDNPLRGVGYVIVGGARRGSMNSEKILSTLEQDHSRWRHVKVIAVVPPTAPLDAGFFARQLRGAPIIRTTRCNFPVETKYQPFPNPRTGKASFVDPALVPLVAARFVLKVLETLPSENGDVICFLPSQADVCQAKWYFEREISGRNRSVTVRVYELFAGQDPSRFAQLLSRVTQAHRVVFSTGELDFDIAMESVACVVDSGLQYTTSCNSVHGSTSLEVRPIDQNLALRRMRLAGRTSPGTCFRLYAQQDFDTMLAEALPSLSEAQDHRDKFKWLDHGVEDIHPILRLSPILDPRHARMIAYATKHGVVHTGIDLVAALLVAKDCFDDRRLHHTRLDSGMGGDGDILAFYRAFCEWKTIAAEQGDKWEASRVWCNDRGIDVMAMRLAGDFSWKLRLLFKNEFVSLCSAQDASGEGTPTSKQLSRIVAAGYIMNTALMKPTIPDRANLSPHYISIRTGEVGSLSCVASKSFLLSTSSPTRLVHPTWIVFCSEDRTQATVTLSLVVPIEEAWIADESTSFAALYKSKRDDLPVASCEWHNLSADVVAHAFGSENDEESQAATVNAVERHLSCNLRVNALLGHVSATGFTPGEAKDIQTKMNTLLDEVRVSLGQRNIEANYMGATRAVIGKGFQVTDVLFGDEFASLNLGGWKGGDVAALSALLQRVSQRAGIEYEGEPVVERVGGSDPESLIVHLPSKHIARDLLRVLRVSHELAGLVIAPKLPTETPAPDMTRTQFAGRMKVTWADGRATGSAKVYFASAADANAFLRSYGTKPAFLSIEVTAFGVLADKASFLIEQMYGEMDSSPEQPPLTREFVRRYSKRVVFDEAAIQRMSTEEVKKLQFCVRIRKGLSLSIDEDELVKLILPARVVHCRINRTTGQNKKALREHKLVRSRVAALTSSLVPPESPIEWVDKTGHRSGVIVYFQDVRRLDQVSSSLDRSDAWHYSDANGPNGQPVRRSKEFTYRTSFAAELHECFKSKFDSILERAREQGVWQPETQPQVLPNGQTIVVLKLVSSDRKVLQGLADSLEAVFECEKAACVDLDVLFSLAGRLKAQEWLQGYRETEGAKKAWIKQDTKTRSFWVFGAPGDRIEAIASLRQVAATIQGHVEVLDNIIRLDISKFAGRDPAEVKRWLAAQPSVMSLYHFTVLGNGSRVALSGSKSQINELLVAWASEGKLLVRDQAVVCSSTARRDCGVCMFPADDPVVQFAVCGHSFCLECIQPGITPTSRLPLMCPAIDCGCFISVQDVAKVSNDFESLVEAAVFDYVARHPNECAVCPKPGCNQILSRATVEMNRFVSCPSCAKSYCLDCSTTTGQPMDRHDDVSCEDFQAHGGAEADRHVRWVRDRILTLRCPQCGAAFLDFDGCMCVCCGNATCHTHFCANCLAFSAQDEQEAHRHVRTCPKNPMPGQYFVSAEKREKLHRKLRKEKLVAYLTSQIPTPHLRRAVLDRVTPDLADLGMTVSPRDVGGLEGVTRSK